MSRVADGHFLEETRSAVDIEGKHVTIQGPSPDLCPASPFALSTGCHDLLLIRSSMCGHPDPFRSVRHLSGVPVGCPLQSGESGSRSSVRLPVGANGASSEARAITPARTVGLACGSSQNRRVSTTPLWVPLVIAALGLAASIIGSIGGVIMTQRRADRREELQWQRDREREQDDRAREDALRTFEQRRACYVDFEEALRGAAQAIWDAGHGTGPPLEKAWHLSAYQSLHRLKIFATPDTALAASKANEALWRWGAHGAHAMTKQLSRVKKHTMRLTPSTWTRSVAIWVSNRASCCNEGVAVGRYQAAWQQYWQQPGRGSILDRPFFRPDISPVGTDRPSVMRCRGSLTLLATVAMERRSIVCFSGVVPCLFR